MRRRLAALAAAVTLLAVAAAPAATAATYPPSPATVTFKLNLPAGMDTDAVKWKQAYLAEFAGFMGVSPVRIKITQVASGLGDGSDGLGSGRGGTGLVLAATTGSCETGGSCESESDSSGVARANLTFTETGKQTITATGVDPQGEELVVSATVTVVDDAGNDGSGEEQGGLANTGSDLIRYSVIGLGLVAVGGVLVLAMRRRSAGGHTA